MPDPVIIVEYDLHWPLLYEQIRATVVAALGDLVLTVEHVGSTAVPGLAAKPIIDLDVVIPSASDIPAAIARLATFGYVYQGDLGIAGREAFRAPPQDPKHHLYVCPFDSEELRRHRAFRDYLLTHPDEVRAYGALKKTCALRFSDDRSAYVEAKGPFVAEILRRALSIEG